MIRENNNKDPAFIVPLPDVKSRGWVGHAVAYTNFTALNTVENAVALRVFFEPCNWELGHMY